MYPIQTHAVILGNKDKKPGQQDPRPVTLPAGKPKEKTEPVFKPDPRVRY